MRQVDNRPIRRYVIIDGFLSGKLWVMAKANLNERHITGIVNAGNRQLESSFG